MHLRSIINSAVLVTFFIATNALAQPGIISTAAGTGIGGYSGDGGPATAAQLNHPGQITADASGNIYIAELNNNVIRKISISGIISTVAGTGVAGYSGDGGPATAAKLNSPYGIAIDGAGNLYIGDFNNQRVRKVNTSGIISTVAGTGTGGYGGDGGPAAAATLWNPGFLNVDGTGNVYVCDNQNQRVRKINVATGIITTVAGNGTAGYSGDGGPATSARLSYPNGIFIDGVGIMYIGDASNNVIRKVNSSGIISTIAGTGVAGYSGDGGPATAAMLNLSSNLYVDAAGNILFADTYNERVRKINTSGIITTIAGTGVAGYSGDGGLATAAQLNRPDGVVIAPSGKIYISEGYNNRIRVIGPNNTPSFSAGATASLGLCESASATSINSLLAATDVDAGQTLAWSTVTAPAHGMLVAAYTTTSTGGTVTPAGLSYTPTAGYSGTDIFTVKVTDGIASDTITIYVAVDPLPNAGVISGIDSVCPGHHVTLSETVAGGIWSCSNMTVTAITFGGVVTGIVPGRDTIIYTVINSCGIVSAILPFKVRSYTACHTGVVDLAHTDINIFPNPSNGTLHVFVPSAAQQTVQIFVTNMLGQKVTEKIVRANGDNTIELDVAPGIYVMDILVGDERYSRKITITR